MSNDIFKLVLRDLQTSVIIGAMDGVLWDDISISLPTYHYEKIVMVEPIPWHFAALKKNYEMHPNVIFENSAITSVTGKTTMITVPPENLIGVPDWIAGCSTLGHHYNTERGTNLIADREFINKIESLSIQVEVNTLTFEDLLKKHNMITVDFIKIDAEGYDWEIMKQIDLTTVKPVVIFFELTHLAESTINSIRSWFNIHNYTFHLIDRNNGCGIKNISSMNSNQ